MVKIPQNVNVALIESSDVALQAGLRTAVCRYLDNTWTEHREDSASVVLVKVFQKKKLNRIIWRK